MSVDLLFKGQAQGAVANEVLAAGGKLNVGTMKPFMGKDGRSYIQCFSGGDPKKPENYKVSLAANAATLRRDEWKTLDDTILSIAESRLGGVQDLVSKGLVYNIGNGLGSTVLEWHDVSDALTAVATMDGVNRNDNDRPVYQTNYLPLPIIHADYEINSRVLAASRSQGMGIDTTMAERAGRKVNLLMEQMLFTAVSYPWGAADDRTGGSTIWSYLNHPDRNLVTLSTYGAWNASAATGATILASVIAMKQASINAYHYGPWHLYIPTLYETVLDTDYDTTTPGTTIRERIMKISGIEKIQVVDTLTAANVLLVQMTSDVVRLVRGMGLQNVEWKSEGQFLTNYKVMTIQVPQIRSDQAGSSGVVHMS